MIDVLLVEASQKGRQSFRDILEDSKFELVSSTAYGAEAIKEYRRHHPDIVVAGLDTPLKKTSTKGGGIKFLKKFKEVFPGARIVISYSIDTQYLVVKAEKEVGAGKVKKPFKEKRTLEALAKSVKDEVGEGVDRRKSIRLEKKFPLRYRKGDNSWLGSWFSGMNNVVTSDISPAGVRFFSEEDVSVDDRLQLEVELPNFGRTINTEGRVVHKQSFTGTDRTEVGVKFTDIDEETYQELNDYLLSLASKE